MIKLFSVKVGLEAPAVLVAPGRLQSLLWHVTRPFT